VLRALKPLSFRDKHADLQSRRTEGLGKWLFKTPEYVKWLDETSDARTLWCYGNPGAGKTYLS